MKTNLMTSLLVIFVLAPAAWPSFAIAKQKHSRRQIAHGPRCIDLAKASKTDIKNKLEEYLDCQHSSLRFSGVILAGYDNDNIDKRNILVEKAYGFADTSKATPRLNDIKTKVLLGSVTKQFVAALTLKLISENKLDIDAKAIDLIPEVIGINNKIWARVTIRELLAHGSGIPDYATTGGLDRDSQEGLDTNAILKETSRRRLRFTPGSTAIYSNTNYLILGKILEHISKMSWPEIVDREIRKPLLMQNTGVYNLADIHSQYAVGYTGSDESTEAKYRDPRLFSAVGDLYSSVEDLFLWEHYLYSTNIIVPSQMRAQYMERPLLKEYSAGAIATSKSTDPDANGRLNVYKTGHLNGYANVVSYFPEDKLVVVILSNVEEYRGQPFIRPLMNQIAGLIFNSEKKSALEITDFRERKKGEGFKLTKP